MIIDGKFRAIENAVIVAGIENFGAPQRFQFSKDFVNFAFAIDPQHSVLQQIKFPFENIYTEIDEGWNEGGYKSGFWWVIDGEDLSASPFISLDGHVSMLDFVYSIPPKRNVSSYSDRENVLRAALNGNKAGKLASVHVIRSDDKPIPEEFIQYNFTSLLLHLKCIATLSLKSKFVSTIRVAPTEKMVRAAAKRSKTSFIEYSEVVVNLTEEQRRFVHDNNQSKNNVRLHSRRGHFKLLKGERLVWWNPCMVGSKDKGLTIHDYKV